MSNAHPRPWHRDSVFGAGPRRPFDREQRARFRFLLNAHRRARRLTPLSEVIGNAMARRLGVNGQLDPSHDTIAADVGCSTRTVQRALNAMKVLGLVMWQRRIVRSGWRTEQTSNAYCLALTENPPPRCGGQPGRQTRRIDTYPVQPVRRQAVATAQVALAERRRAVEARLLNRRSGSAVLTT